MNGDTPKYIKKYENFSHTDCIAISFNQSGANILNSINEKYSVLITKYYRDIKSSSCCLPPEAKQSRGTNETYILEQKVLTQNQEFPLKDYSAPYIQKFCTEGMNPDKLPGKEMRESHGFGFLKDPENQIHPCRFNTGYDKDTGLCNFSELWCSHMGFSDITTEQMLGITEKNNFPNCEVGTGQEIAELLLPELAVQGLVRLSE